MSTNHVDELVNTGKVHFQSKTEVRKPDVIFDYNLNMAGIDYLSLVIIPYNIKEKVETNGEGRFENYSLKVQFITHFLFSKTVTKLHN